MIVLNLTTEDGNDLVICGQNITVLDNSGNKIPYSEKLYKGCRVKDGLHNNGGWQVKERFKDVAMAIEIQVKGLRGDS